MDPPQSRPRVFQRGGKGMFRRQPVVHPDQDAAGRIGQLPAKGLVGFISCPGSSRRHAGTRWQAAALRIHIFAARMTTSGGTPAHPRCERRCGPFDRRQERPAAFGVMPAQGIDVATRRPDCRQRFDNPQGACVRGFRASLVSQLEIGFASAAGYSLLLHKAAPQLCGSTWWIGRSNG